MIPPTASRDECGRSRCPGRSISVAAPTTRINDATGIGLAGRGFRCTASTGVDVATAFKLTTRSGSFRCADTMGIDIAAALRPQSSQPTPEPCEDSRNRLRRTGLRPGGGREGGQHHEGENADEAAEADSRHGKRPLSRARSGPATAAGRARLQRNGAPSRVKKFGRGTSTLFTNVCSRIQEA